MRCEEEACEEALKDGASTGTGRLTKLELSEIPMEFYLDPRCRKMKTFDISHNALQTLNKVYSCLNL